MTFDPDVHDDDELARAEIEERVAGLRREAELEALKFLMVSSLGRAFAWWFLSLSGVDFLSFTGDNDSTNFREGRRSMGVDLREEIMQVAPLMYDKMRQEAAQREAHFQAQAGQVVDEG